MDGNYYLIFLIDVFNREGKFIDNFYLGFQGSLLTAKGDFIYALEKDADENWIIVKYKIID